jgi:hypothetical protein
MCTNNAHEPPRLSNGTPDGRSIIPRCIPGTYPDLLCKHRGPEESKCGYEAVKKSAYAGYGYLHVDLGDGETYTDA